MSALLNEGLKFVNTVRIWHELLGVQVNEASSPYDAVMALATKSASALDPIHIQMDGGSLHVSMGGAHKSVKLLPGFDGEVSTLHTIAEVCVEGMKIRRHSIRGAREIVLRWGTSANREAIPDDISPAEVALLEVWEEVATLADCIPNFFGQKTVWNYPPRLAFREVVGKILSGQGLRVLVATFGSWVPTWMDSLDLPASRLDVINGTRSAFARIDYTPDVLILDHVKIGPGICEVLKPLVNRTNTVIARGCTFTGKPLTSNEAKRALCKDFVEWNFITEADFKLNAQGGPLGTNNQQTPE